MATSIALLLQTTLLVLLMAHASASGHPPRKVQETLLPPGIWTFRGYGYVIQIEDGTVTLLEETENSCIINSFLMEGIYDAQLSPVNENNVALVSVYRFVPYFVLDRTSSFKAGCRQDR